MTGPHYSIPPRKQVERTQLAEAMTKFQRNGGKVDVLPSLHADKPPKIRQSRSRRQATADGHRERTDKDKQHANTRKKQVIKPKAMRHE
ncbi:hypothetical protein XfCFBP8356_010505 [Xylella fastidiosa subsp. sandyi]|uniref:Uncharacterized protein n=1 Tax=Xylella fastidiosa subsp. fastidiosa TaxID=644356 RepID=A0AAJ5QYX5_XYLFS|nr:hypothetical protein [Xylella fastidiosa]RWA43479.1 hypothetical protein XfCFBP8356_11680 [Xylella fastidiosa subsp. sandyi]WCF27751.1 hypothetical protein OK117_08900 [Xylella fastidiosa subsp. fastidiosa]WCF27875.1 hypothetical protein OK117_09580 [Xylella fastidiosa subsp. fastidiosa]